MNEMKHDYVIVGAGPAGLQLAYLLQKAGRDFVILEAGEGPGTFFKSFPRHRKLISANKVYTGYTDAVRNMRWDWNSLISDDETLLFKHYSKEFFPNADCMVEYLQDFAARHKLPVKYASPVKHVSRDGAFRVETAQGDVYFAKRLVMATGVSRPYVPSIPGIEHAELYTDMSINPEDFANQKVLILGKGNSAFETADHLMNTSSRLYVCSPTPISLAWKTKFVGHLRAVNNNFIDTYQLKLQNVMLDAQVLSIVKKDGQLVVTFHYNHADGEVEVMAFDRVLACTGFRFDASMFDDTCKPALAINDRFPAQTPGFESINVKDLFFVGTIMQERDFKKKQSGFVHGFRHNIESFCRLLDQRYHGVPWPSQELKPEPAVLAAAVLARANRSPGLWQQTGFLGDVIVRTAEGSYRYYQDVPTQFIKDSDFGGQEDYYVVTLEFGLEIINASPDALAVARIHKDDIANAALSTGIHPIIRRYCKGNLLAEHHVVEDIIPEWDDVRTHVAPLVQFFAKQLVREDSAGGQPCLESMSLDFA